MDYKNILHQINQKQIDNFYTIDNFIDGGTSILPRNKRGLYWIWANLTDDDLSKSKWISNSKHVNIADLIKKRKDLTHVCTIEHEGFRIVYNGIGGYKSATRNFGLRERILQEFNATSKGTGTLTINSTELDISKFAISYFNFDDEANKKNFLFLNENEPYLNYASDLEKLWRLEFGHPILCRI
jgi:hypothetical protein